MRNQGIFLVFILCLTLGLSLASQVFHEHYSDSQDLHQQISHLNEQREKEALKVTLLQNQMEDLKAHVYQTLDKKTTMAWNEKQWLASLRGPASVAPLEPKSGTLMANAKKDFIKKDFPAAGEKLKQLIEKYPTSRDIIEAHFLLAEAYYLSGQAEASLDLVDQMMTRYPESELTGYIMLRMGQILQNRNQNTEAREVFDTVIRQFPKSAQLKDQASRLSRMPASL